MTFEGYDLRETLRGQEAAVEIRDGRGQVRGRVSPHQALGLAIQGAFIGVGTSGTIRFMRPLASPAKLYTGSIRDAIAEDVSTTVGRRVQSQHRWLSQKDGAVDRWHGYNPEHRRMEQDR